MGVAAVVLAAGMSTRMGQIKMLLPFGDKPVLARVLDNLIFVRDISPIIVITGHAEQEILPVLCVYKDVQTVPNPDYATGEMLSSVQVGVRALPADCAAFFLVLGDQPMVCPETLIALTDAWSVTHAPIILPTYKGRRGHPILFAAACVSEILSLPSDATLRDVVTRYRKERHEVPVPDAAVIADLDTPEDYEHALRAWQARASR